MPRGMDVERLLVLVQGHPEIWDTRSEAYHNRTAKEDAWEEVAKELFGQEWESGRTRDRSRLVQEIKTRWRSCRDQFRREMGERGRSGDGASRKRPYMYTQQLMFLKDIMEMRTTTDNLEDTAEETELHMGLGLGHLKQTAFHKHAKCGLRHMSTDTKLPVIHPVLRRHKGPGIVQYSHAGKSNSPRTDCRLKIFSCNIVKVAVPKLNIS
ncbi:uncharacterized protein LOC142656667 [Rhinoderma darwinii]|uniref:uncharacterized protein LOC142656667 n=1 Tax=Rhinoderma darwinii TaxID=43563 RepID=UPI003F66ED1C